MSVARGYRLRYTRWQDRALALVWRRKRRHLRIAQALLDESADEIRRATDLLLRDAMLHGAAFIGPYGERIDPKEIHRG